ncbi:hypothetical protein IFR05_004048 [Cadophora sp. M221]|nr:hypothetical protein IFR05_004048 [Cadophora sp. M221]
MPSNMDNTLSASALSEALSKLALSENNSEISEDTTMTEDTTSDFSDTTMTEDITSNFNDRTAEVRDARMANAILCLDEDIPENLDDSIKELLQKHASNTNASALGPMSFMVSEHYLEFNAQQAAKKATEKKLPRSKGRSVRQQATPF